MKKTVSKEGTRFLQSAAVLLLVSLLTAFLYMMDWIGTGVFTLFCQLIGFLIYGAAGLTFVRLFPKRVMIFALAACVVLAAIYFTTQPLMFKKALLFLAKLLVFLAVIFFLKGKTN